LPEDDLLIRSKHAAPKTTTYSVVSSVITSATNLKHNGMYNLKV